MSEQNQELYTAIDVRGEKTTVCLINQFSQLIKELSSPTDSFGHDRGIGTAINLFKQLLTDQNLEYACGLLLSES